MSRVLNVENRYKSAYFTSYQDCKNNLKLISAEMVRETIEMPINVLNDNNNDNNNNNNNNDSNT